MGEVNIYPYDDKKTAYLHGADGVTERSVTLPENIYEKIETLTEEVTIEEYNSRNYDEAF